ncbi:MAG: septal ring factor EnvC (AmiA/AmiB activator) [Chitinophagales bacterium]|jgi:septal ring factor EnvC (AmiA/AmiB activator)
MTSLFNIKKVFGKTLMLFILALGLVTVSFSQSNKKAELQNKYKKLQEDIKKIESLIANTQSEKSNSLEQLKSINSKINTRQSLINNINAQVIFIQKNIDDKQEVIVALDKDIGRLKDDYADMVVNAYRNKHSSNALSFLFSSDNFNQALQRFSYMRSYATTRANQSALIAKTIEDLNAKIQKLEEEKVAKEAFLNEEKKQRFVLQEEKLLKSDLINRLQGDEENLKKQINEKNKAAQALNNQIQKIIEEEIKLAKEKAAKTAAAKGEAPVQGLALTPDEKQLSKDFIYNMGKLPWPVSKGFIVSKFGKHEHESLKQVYTNNNGVDIKTEEGADVRVVFNGTVVNSFYLPSTQNSVIVKHGEYYSVYSNLKTVAVSAGQKLSTKESIGVAYTENKQTKVHLEIWKGMEKTNPELWLAR